MILSFSNPRTTAFFPDWKMGNYLVECRFVVEVHPTKGYRLLRYLQRFGREQKTPKSSRWNGRCCIVNGNDNGVYLLQRTRYGTIRIRNLNPVSNDKGIRNFLDIAEPVQKGTELYESLLTLILSSSFPREQS